MSGTGDEAPMRISDTSWLREPALQAVFSALEDAGGTARVAGGAVRNALLARPITDVDIATDLPPETVQSSLDAAGIKTAATGLKHGTLTAIVEGKGGVRTFEVTTLRVDVETHGRHATVSFTDDWRADAERRDFTINAIYCDRHGNLFDPIGGYRDIERRRVAFVGDPAARIEEDYLRILRFFRIHAVYGEGALDAAGLAACIAHADGLARLSAERVRQEMWKLLVAPRALEVVAEIHRDGILARLLGRDGERARFEALCALEQVAGEEGDPLLRLAALAPPDAAGVADFRHRFKLTNAETKRLALLAEPRAVMMPSTGAHDARVALYRNGARGFRDTVLFDLSACAADEAAAAVARLMAVAEAWGDPAFPLSGRDVVAAGVPPGRQVGEVLDRLEAEWIASDFSLDPKSLRARIRELAK